MAAIASNARYSLLLFIFHFLRFLSHVKYEIHCAAEAVVVILTKTRDDVWLPFIGTRQADTFLVAYAPTEAYKAPEFCLDTDTQLQPMSCCFLPVQLQRPACAIGGIGECRVPDVVFEAAEAVADDAEEAVPVVLLVEVVVEAEAQIGCCRTEGITRFCALAMTVTDAELCNREVLVTKVDSSADLHIGEFGIHSLHGKANNVGTDCNTAEQRGFLLLFLLLLGMQRSKGQAD